MSAFALISGRIVQPPVERKASNGRLAACATVRVAGTETEYWLVQTFSNAGREELLRLGANDHVACQGVMRISSQRVSGDLVVQRHLVADLVVSLKPREGSDV